MPRSNNKSPAAEIAFSLRHTAWQKKRAQLKRLVERAANATLTHLETTQVEYSVLLTNDAALQQLNHDFRGKDKPTNVLAFPSDISTSHLPPATRHSLGDLAISLDTVTREAKEQGKSFEAHLTHMVVHGTLHLLGYDHEMEAEADAMEKLEISILQCLGHKNPYA